MLSTFRSCQTIFHISGSLTLIRNQQTLYLLKHLSTKSALRCFPLAVANHQLHVVRFVRTGSNQSKSNENENKEEQKNEQKTAEEVVEEWKKLDPATVKRLRIFMLIVVITTCGISFLALYSLTGLNSHLKSAMEQEPIDFDVFLKKYLPTGEVQKLIYSPEERRAIAVLVPGAIIDGQPAQFPVIAVRFDRTSAEQPNQFNLEVRHAEEQLGIPLREAIPIEITRGISLFRVFEFALGFMILGFLFTQYGRLMRRTILQKRAEDAAAKAKKQEK